ncbi:MAG: helix-turn-helix transcriptional regulator [Clostridia bacterium]|nr:helix-turn-helix transcriptional regulator [Clostridia bacterium]
MNAYDFGSILKLLRKNHNLTQEELGARIGLSKAVISKYENGIGYPTFDTLIHIAEHFAVTTDFLLGVEKSKTIDVSSLNETQIETIQRIIAEFNKCNK